MNGSLKFVTCNAGALDRAGIVVILTIIRYAVVVAVLLLDAPLVVEAQPAVKVWTIGYLAVGPPERSLGQNLLVEGLRALGYVEGKNLRIERRFANNKLDLLPSLAAELVRLPVAVVVAGDSQAILSRSKTRRSKA